jgi:probable rRNA maturation factor
MKVEIFNRQRRISVILKGFLEFTEAAVNASPQPGKSVSIEFVTDERMKELNERFRGKDAVTDVLSFPNEPDELDADENYLGDMVIALDQAERQAQENGLDFDQEVKQLILHGILHLCGFDHETDGGEMNRLELELREQLGVSG